MRDFYSMNPSFFLCLFRFFLLGGRRDEDGFYWVTGRVDDRLNVSGHLLSTMEVEAALVNHKCVAETAVVPHPHPVKGECLYCFIVLRDVSNESKNNTTDIRYSAKIDRLQAKFQVAEVLVAWYSRSTCQTTSTLNRTYHFP